MTRTLDPTTDAAITSIAASLGVDVVTAQSLLSLGAARMLDTMIQVLETDCSAYAESLPGERRDGAHLAVGVMVGKLKILRSMTEGNTDGR